MEKMKFIKKLLYIDEVDSTNSYLLRNRSTYKSGTAEITLSQTSGRGRGNHIWDSNGCVAISVLIKNAAARLLPLAAAVAAACAVQHILGLKTQIKWPNDILIEEKKICGILCEAKLCSQDSITSSNIEAVCGAGFNLYQSQDYFEAVKLPHASSIYAQTGKILNYTDLALQFLLNLEQNIKLINVNAYTLLDEYKKKCITVGRQVKIMPGGDIAEAVDIAEDGALIVMTKSGREKIYGEVSVRGVNGYV